MSHNTIKILTLNLHKGFGHFNRQYILPSVKNGLIHLAPDLVFLQEVLGANHKDTPEGFHENEESQYEYLADTVWQDYAYGRNAVYPKGHHGNAILSRFPILESRNIDISEYALEQRGFLYAKIEHIGAKKNLHAICVHLGLFNHHRKLQMKRILHFIDQNIPSHEPLIVAGDFNDWSMKFSKHSLETTEVHDAYREIHGKYARTFPAFFPILPLDRIYLRSLLAKTATSIKDSPWNQLSDHIPIFSEAEFS